MGAFGPGIFQNDADMAALTTVQTLLGLHEVSGLDELLDNGPLPDDVRLKLERFLANAVSIIQNPTSMLVTFKHSEVGPEHLLVVLGLVAMRLGLHIEEEVLVDMKNSIGVMGTAMRRVQARTAFEEYKNERGIQWVFQTIPLSKMMSLGAKAQEILQRHPGVNYRIAINHPIPALDLCLVGNGVGHSSDEEPYDQMHSKRCWNCNKDNPAFSCSRCKIMRYCNKLCQTEDWNQEHKTYCNESATTKPPDKELVVGPISLHAISAMKTHL